MDWIAHFLEYIKYEKRFSPETYTSYKTDLHQYLEFLTARKKELKDATYKDIRLWIADELSKKSARSVNRKISTLKSFYKFLVRNNYTSVNPTDKVISPKYKNPLPVFVSETSMNTLFEHVEFPKTFEGIRDKTIIEMFYATGIRLSELINIKMKDIDLYNYTVKVLGKRRKERLIPFSKKLLPILKEYIKIYENEFGNVEQENFFFVTKEGKVVYRGLIYKTVKKYLDMVSTVEKRSPHVIRHTFATHLLNNGADISAIKELLGHNSLATTQIYTHTSVEKLKQTYKQAHPRA